MPPMVVLTFLLQVIKSFDTVDGVDFLEPIPGGTRHSGAGWTVWPPVRCCVHSPTHVSQAKKQRQMAQPLVVVPPGPPSWTLPQGLPTPPPAPPANPLQCKPPKNRVDRMAEARTRMQRLETAHSRLMLQGWQSFPKRSLRLIALQEAPRQHEELRPEFNEWGSCPSQPASPKPVLICGTDEDLEEPQGSQASDLQMSPVHNPKRPRSDVLSSVGNLALQLDMQKLAEISRLVQARGTQARPLVVIRNVGNERERRRRVQVNPIAPTKGMYRKSAKWRRKESRPFFFFCIPKSFSKQSEQNVSHFSTGFRRRVFNSGRSLRLYTDCFFWRSCPGSCPVVESGERSSRQSLLKADEPELVDDLRKKAQYLDLMLRVYARRSKESRSDLSFGGSDQSEDECSLAPSGNGDSCDTLGFDGQHQSGLVRICGSDCGGRAKGVGQDIGSAEYRRSGGHPNPSAVHESAP